jgi:hypothetical protein
MNDVLSSWFHIQHEHNKIKNNVKDIVRNNSCIKLDNKLVYYKTWHNKDILNDDFQKHLRNRKC